MFKIAILAGLLLLAAGSYLYVRRPPPDNTITLQTPRGGEFTLPSTQGLYDSRAHHGKVRFLFFGFLNCPHICPMTLQRLREAHKLMTPEERSRMQVLFVSVDPGRDPLPKIAKYFVNYPPGFIGSTGTDQELMQVTQLFGARYARRGADDGSVSVDHTSEVFVINGNGEWSATLPFSAKPEAFVEAMRAAGHPQEPGMHPRPPAIEVLAEDTSGCDIGEKECTVKTASGEEFRLQIGPGPAAPLKPLTVSASAQNKSRFVPVEVDFVGVELDMGLIRPALRQRQGRFEAAFELPVCDLKAMTWRARLIVNDLREGRLVAAIFNFKSAQPQ